MVKIIVAHHRVRRSSNKPFLNQEVTSTQTKYSISTIPSSFDLLKIHSTKHFYAQKEHIPFYEREKHRRQKSGLFLLPEECCCLICSLFFAIGLCAAIAAAVLETLPSSKESRNISKGVIATTITTTSITMPTTMPTTTSTTMPTTTSTEMPTTTSTTMPTTTSTPFNSTFNINLLFNGNGETGPCENSNGVTHPTGWNYNGTITQMYYNVASYGPLTSANPGPSDRGNCFFFGQISTTTSMWQTVNLTNTIDPHLIDNHVVKFNLSAWIGGWSSQNDNAQVSVIFFDQTNQIIGSQTTIGPVLAADRGSQSSLLFRQANDYVPIGARSFTVIVLITCSVSPSNDGSIDNIGIYLYT